MRFSEHNGTLLPQAFVHGIWSPSFAPLVRRELEAIAYGIADASLQERCIAGYLTSQLFNSYNYRIWSERPIQLGH